MVERLRFDKAAEMLVPYEQGAFVRYSDYTTLSARVETLEAALRACRTFVITCRAEAKGRNANRYKYADETLTQIDAALAGNAPAEGEAKEAVARPHTPVMQKCHCGIMEGVCDCKSAPAQEPRR